MIGPEAVASFRGSIRARASLELVGADRLVAAALRRRDAAASHHVKARSTTVLRPPLTEEWIFARLIAHAVDSSCAVSSVISSSPSGDGR